MTPHIPFGYNLFTGREKPGRKTPTMPATTFTTVHECFRCGGFKRAFSTFSHTNGGRCLRCNGGLRTLVTKPVARMDEYIPAAERRARAIATIAKILEITGEPRVMDESGKAVSPWGFAYRVKGDDMMVFAAALTIAPEAVRVRGWRAFCAVARAKLGDRAERVIAKTRALAAEYAGTGSEGVGAWLGESATAEAVSA